MVHTWSTLVSTPCLPADGQESTPLSTSCHSHSQIVYIVAFLYFPPQSFIFNATEVRLITYLLFLHLLKCSLESIQVITIYQSFIFNTTENPYRFQYKVAQRTIRRVSDWLGKKYDLIACSTMFFHVLPCSTSLNKMEFLLQQLTNVLQK